MATRVNISLPDDLHKRLQAVKDKIPSVSKICQEAIEMSVNHAEHIQTVPNQKEVIQRLRTEKERHDSEVRNEGIRAGWTDFKTLEYGDIRMIIRGDKPDWFEEHMQTLLDEDDYEEQKGLFGEGWVVGIEQAWAEVEEQVTSQG